MAVKPNRSAKRKALALARKDDGGYYLKVYFSSEEEKQSVKDFAKEMSDEKLQVSTGEFMRSAILRTMIEMTHMAAKAKEVFDKKKAEEEAEGELIITIKGEYDEQT